MVFWERRGKQSGLRQATFLNQRLAQLVTNEGSIYYESPSQGYSFVSEAYTILSERQTYMGDGCYFHMNDRTYQLLGADLAGRGTLSGRPEEAYKTGMIGREVAGFSGVFRSSYLSSLTGGATPDTTVTGDQSFVPEGVDTTTGTAINVDYRIAEVPVADSSLYNVGDKIEFINGADPVQSIALADKTLTGQPMTFTIKAIPTATSLVVSPKPIALDDPALTAPQAAYANVNTQILNGALVRRLNLNTSPVKTDIFWCKEALEVLGGEAPVQLLSEFGGMKVVSKTMSNGQTMYMAYDGNINTLNFTCRLFTWWGITMVNPSAAGVAISTA